MHRNEMIGRSRYTHLLGIDNIHNDAALQHLGKTSLDSEVLSDSILAGSAGGGVLLCHFVW